MELRPIIKNKRRIGGVDMKSFMLLFGIIGFIIGSILLWIYFAKVF